MCGIFCSLSKTAHVAPDSEVLELLKRRGPDSTGTSQRVFHSEKDPNGNPTYLTFASTVLSLRGSQTVSQPLQRSSESEVLCWNGEAWAIRGKAPEGNDTENVFTLIAEAVASSRNATSTSGAAVAVANYMSTIAGPYAFVFYDHAEGRLYFGRDFLGRRALLWKTDEYGNLLMSSITSGTNESSWKEVEADGVYCIDLISSDISHDSCDSELDEFGHYRSVKVPYTFTNGERHNALTSVIPPLCLNEDESVTQDRLTVGSPSVLRLEELLRNSLGARILNIPDPPPNARSATKDTQLRITKLAILFSGGLDCTVLARLAHDLLDPSEPIDLLNVAFQNPRVHKSCDSEEAAYESCPDRLTGRASFEELCEVCPDREWRFVAVNVPYAEFAQHREQVITLMHPHSTEMDLSIASALYFAARGSGQMSSTKIAATQAYSTSARVLLSGLGADELFAGYTRHATAFSRNGMRGLLDELNLDIGRLGKRNLGRDDRVIANWGKEARFPFLDERLVAWALQAPVSSKCDFGATQSAGDDPSAELESCKKVLRCLAWRLGMHKVASEKKRAIQFGARTAKMETGKSKGTTLVQ